MDKSLRHLLYPHYSLPDEWTRSEVEKKAWDAFDKSLAEHIGSFDEDHIQFVPNNEMAEPIFDNYEDIWSRKLLLLLMLPHQLGMTLLAVLIFSQELRSYYLMVTETRSQRSWDASVTVMDYSLDTNTRILCLTLVYLLPHFQMVTNKTFRTMF